MGEFRIDDAAGLRSHWFVVADASDVGEGPVGVRLLGDPLVVWRTADGALAAAADRCPHREAPLSHGRVEGSCLVCPYHGWTFDDAGACVRIPSSPPESPVPPSARLTTVGVRERYGLVWVCPEPDVGGGGDIPAIREDDDPSFRRINAGTEVWSTSITRMVDNFCDVAHFPYVHPGTLGADVSPVVDRIEVDDLGDGFVGYRYRVDVDNAAGTRVTQEMSTSFALPTSVRSTTRFVSGVDAGSRRVLLLCSTPIDDHTSLFTFVVWRNADDGVSDDDQIAFDRRVGAEDRTMLERIAGHLPLDQRSTVSVQSDRLSVEWRRQFAAIAADGSPPGSGARR